MSNMSYCRFENTLADLRDCLEQLFQGCLVNKDEYEEYLSESEFDSAVELIEMCRDITEMYKHSDLYEARELYNKIKND